MPEERKLVTVVFADVTGSTALGEALDPEDVRALMSRYYEHADRIVATYGGTLEKFIGDAVMAVFGLPQAHGDDAERALAAALALRDAVAEDAVLRGRLLLRVGVNTGEVVATSEPARGDFLVTGDAVNVAARLQQAASPGEILASERTCAAAEAAFDFGEPRTAEVKGKSRPLWVRPLSGPRPVRQMKRPPFVGRRQDLAQLNLLRERALEEQRPQLVSIVAPGGTGKTRLLEEFLARLDPDDGFQVATARCPPYGQTLTYWPLRSLLDELLGGHFSPVRVADAFASGGHSNDDAARLAGLVLATLGIEGEAQVERTTVFNAWRLLVEALARQAPRIVVFEDLHWASDSLLDLVEHIMHPRTQAPLLVVALSRPELLDRRPAWGGGQGSFTALALEPLRTRQMRELVGRLAEDLPEATREQIVARAGGNPFFAIELTRALTERGPEEQTPLPLSLPDTVHEAVLARLDLLAPPERAVLQVASVAGRTFWPAMIQAVLGAPTSAEIDAAIDGLVARDLITPVEGGAYTFRHILFRDVAYGTLSRAERIRLHASVASWLEAFAADQLDEFAELIAYHYREAVVLARQSAVPFELPIDPARAVHFLKRAGKLESYAGAYAEARNHLQSAIVLAPEEAHAGLYELLGDYVHQAFRDTALDAYRRALERWRASGASDHLVGARLLRKLLLVYLRWGAGKPDEAELVTLRAEARQLAEAAGDEDELWRVRVADLFWLGWRGSVTPEEAQEGRSVGLGAAAYFEAREDWAALSEALDAYASLSTQVGAHQDALEASRRRLAVPELSAGERGDAVGMLARAHFNLGEYERCIATVREALAQIRPGESVVHLALGESRGQAVVHLAFGVSRAAQAAWYTGRWDELGVFISAVEQAGEQSQHEQNQSLMWGYFIALHVALARDERAAAESAAALLEHIISPDRDPEWYRLFAAYRQDDPCGILDAAPEMWTFATPYPEILMFLSERGVHAPPTLLEPAAAEAHAEQVPFPIQCGAIAQALAADDDVRLAAAIDDAETHEMIPHAARMRVVLAQRIGDRTPLERARPVLERLGDRQFLRRLEEVEASMPALVATKPPKRPRRR
jgi:class 3 adenylate cyclase